MELNSQLVAPTLTGVAAFLLAWLAFGKGRSKAQATAAAHATAAASAASADERETKPPPRPSNQARKERGDRASACASLPSLPRPAKPKSTRPAAKAIVWEAPPGELDDEDITVLHAIPVFENAADLTIEAASVSIEGNEEDRVSRIELSYEEDAEAEEVTSASARILLYAAGDSDQGRVRKRNEDSMLVMPERSLFAVADGMGGHRGGAVASSLAIDALQDAFDREAFEGRVQSNGNVPQACA